jgi:ATP-binding cassette subfamily C (CFTR/MRP) protein 1
VSLTSECLFNIKTLKTFSLIEVFEDQIKLCRQSELRVQLNKFFVGMLMIAFIFLFPQLMSTITIVVFIYLGNSLDLSTAYTIKIIFNYIKDPMRLLPMFIAQLLEFKLSMTRIQQFLVCDEINPSLTNLMN